MSTITPMQNSVMRNNIFQGNAFAFEASFTGAKNNDWNYDNWYTTAARAALILCGKISVTKPLPSYLRRPAWNATVSRIPPVSSIRAEAILRFSPQVRTLTAECSSPASMTTSMEAHPISGHLNTELAKKSSYAGQLPLIKISEVLRLGNLLITLTTSTALPNISPRLA